MQRKAQLVCQHLEHISSQALEDYQDIIRRYVRHRHGIYALYRRGKLYYVGLASSLQGRLAQHLKDRHAQLWDRFSVYITIGDHHIKELESLLLRVVKPAGNKQKGKFVRSEDLRRRLQQDICNQQKAERDAVFGTPQRPPPAAKSTSPRCGTPGEPPRTAVLARYISQGTPIRARHKGKTLTARINRDGTIRFAGNLYTSPSLAGAAAVQRPSCNGWTFWTYQRAPGDWVSLDALRK